MKIDFWVDEIEGTVTEMYLWQLEHIFATILQLCFEKVQNFVKLHDFSIKNP